MAKITYYSTVTFYFNGNSGEGLRYNEILLNTEVSNNEATWSQFEDISLAVKLFIIKNLSRCSKEN